MSGLKSIQDKLLSNVYELLGNNSGQLELNTLIQDHCNRYNINESQLSKILELPRPSLKRILEKEIQKLDIITALKIAHLTETDILDIIKIYISELPVEKIQEVERTRKIAFILKNFDLEELKKSSFIDSTKDYEHIEHRINSFFGLNSVFEYKNLEALSALYSKANLNSADKMKDFWIRCAISQFTKIANPNEYDPENLVEIFPNIRSYTLNEEKGFITVVKALYKLGVTVIVQPYLTKTSVYGATFVVNEKPCIVLTDCRKRYDILWFTLIHELHHVLNDLEQLKKINFHISGDEEGDVFLLEEKANFFAREFLLGEEKLNIAKGFIIRADKIKAYAQRNNVHPSVIYGHYLKHIPKEQQKIEYPKYQKYLLPSGAALQDLHKFNPYKAESIEVISKYIVKAIEN